MCNVVIEAFRNGEESGPPNWWILKEMMNFGVLTFSSQVVRNELTDQSSHSDQMIDTKPTNL